MTYFLIQCFIMQYNLIYIYSIIYIYILYIYIYKINEITLYFIDYEYNLPKLIAFFSTMETVPYFMFILISAIGIIQYKHKKFNEWLVLIYLIISYVITTPILPKHYNINTNFFNQLLNHTLGSIHPILIFTSLFLIKWFFFSNIKQIYLFYLLSIAIWLGMLWSSNLFGWGGLWNWDPIEEISFYYWITMLICIHYKKNIYFFYLYMVYDIYFSFLFKINIIESIHMFHKELSNYIVNNYSFSMLFTIYIVGFTQIMFVLYRKRTTNVKKNIYINIYVSIYIFFILLHYNISLYDIDALFYITTTTMLILFSYTIYLLSNSKITLIAINPLFILNTIFFINKNIYLFCVKHTIYFIFFMCSYLYYIYTKEFNTVLTSLNYYFSEAENITLFNNIENFISIIENKIIYSIKIVDKEEQKYTMKLTTEYLIKNIKNQISTSNYTTFISLNNIMMYTIKLKTYIKISSYFLIIIIYLMCIALILQMCYKNKNYIGN